MPANTKRLSGYDSLALLLGRYPELAVFRKFGKLSMKCLLYKQAEITYLENELDIFSRRNCADPEKHLLANSWHCFAQSAVPDEDVCYQREKVEEMQQKIQQYRKWRSQLTDASSHLTEAMLLQTTEVLRLKTTQKSDLSALKDWLGRPEGGDHFLNGREYDPWEDKNNEDLVSLYSSAHGDTFAQKLWNRFCPGTTKSLDGG